MINWDYFEIIANEIHDQEITSVYIKSKDDNREGAFLTVIIVNFRERTVGHPAYLGSYATFRAPTAILEIDPDKDDLSMLKKAVDRMPRKELKNIGKLLRNSDRNNNDISVFAEEDSNLNEKSDNNQGTACLNILDEEIGECLTELAARYNYFYQQKMLTKKAEKAIRKECALTDNLVFELAALCFEKYYKRS